MSRRTRVTVGLLTAAAAVAGALLLFSLRSDEPELPAAEAAAFLEAWEKADAPGAAALAVPGTDPAPAQATFAKDLGIISSTFELGTLRREGEVAVAPFSAVHQLRGLGEWRVASSIKLLREDDRWLVAWEPSALHPAAEPGDRFERQRARPERAAILGAGGEPLTVIGDVVAIGVQPSRIRDRAVVAAALQQAAGVDPPRLDSALAAPGVKPDHFVPLIDVREERFRQLEPTLRPVPGVVFRRHGARLTPSEGFAAHTVGRTGEITAEQLEELGPAYQAGDIVGRSGLELAYEKQLAGAPSGEVRLAPAAGPPPRVLHRFPGRPPEPLATTLRIEVQQAADAALEGVPKPAAIVAVDVATGGIVAVASRPLTEPLNRALSGRYPPGSTFKIVTTEALISKGNDAAGAVLPCPAEAIVGGKRFKNFEGEALGTASLRDAFVHSCNTAFVSAAERLEGAALADAASRFGFGLTYGTGLGRRMGGSFPEPADTAERAAAAIGQGRVLATPAHMASVAAAIASGTWRAPTLLAAGAEQPAATPTPAAAEAIRLFMRAVVTDGTGRAAAGVSGLAGKTGTAEYGTGDPLPTHAWFVGFRGGTSFSVLIEGGGVGGRDAAPVAARFAAAL